MWRFILRGIILDKNVIQFMKTRENESIQPELVDSMNKCIRVTSTWNNGCQSIYLSPQNKIRRTSCTYWRNTSFWETEANDQFVPFFYWKVLSQFQPYIEQCKKLFGERNKRKSLQEEDINPIALCELVIKLDLTASKNKLLLFLVSPLLCLCEHATFGM